MTAKAQAATQTEEPVNEAPAEAETAKAPATPREYRSVLITIDHLSTRKDDHVVQKMVKSTQDVTESLLALLAYFNDQKLLHSPATISLFQEAAKSDLPCFVYRTPRNTVEIIMAEHTYAALIVRKGTLLEAEDFIVNTAGQFLKEVQDQKGEAVPLLLFSFTTDREG